MLTKVKLDLRISHNKLDSVIQDDIDACLMDLERVGVVTRAVNDPLVVKAVKLYCRWQQNFENQADRYMHAYKMLRNAISLSGDHNV